MKLRLEILLMLAVCLSSIEVFCQTDSQTPNNEMKNFIYVLRLAPQYQNEENWTEEVIMIANSHFNYLKGMHDDGKAFFVGRTDYDVDDLNNFGIVIFKAESLEEADTLMSNDPAVKNGLMTAELHPFKVVFDE